MPSASYPLFQKTGTLFAGAPDM